MSNDIFKKRAEYSKMRLEELKMYLSSLEELKNYPKLTVFGAGSYARLEASKYSDIDVFFLYEGNRKDLPNPHTLELRLFGKVIETTRKMGFPEFSNDCEYLAVLDTNKITTHLGSRKDDYLNYFTARMLLLLESKCLYGVDTYNNVIKSIVNSYFKDYHDHPKTFQPTFLLNDICRFWKTLLLNYEKKRNYQEECKDVENRKIKDKIRNFKLKFSRMSTCFASIAALGSHRRPVTEQQVIDLIQLTPQERLLSITKNVSEADTAIKEVLEKYAWFLEMTGLSTKDLETHFSDKEKRTEMFKNANDYGDSMFKLLLAIDNADSRIQLLRHLVI